MLASRERDGGLVAAARHGIVRRIAGLLALVTVSAFVAGAASAENAAPAAKPATTARTPKRAPVTQPAAAPVVRSADGAAPAAAKPAKGSRTTFASVSSTGAPVVMPATRPSGPAGSSLAHLDDHLTYQYNALGRRDPFQSLVDGAFVGADQGGDAPPDIGGVKVVGVVWGASDQFALVEDARGNSFVLRKGDKIQNGYVEGLKRDGVIVNITTDGQSQSVVIPLTKKGEQK